MAPTQDLPPAGGFAPIRYKRNLPQRGPPGFLYFLVGTAAIAYGMYKVGEGNHKNWCVQAITISRASASPGC